ncbi:DUF6705 family protein [Chryseobacterium jejuense]|uniref:DUF6705 domain-containing protein n=1 Tax=Chryseobacterium jejuense TaxID=445960 RepID=A0A2X2VKZ0_CHRJE|nr:DUF6705 family protein [Chryseobacterium jejuense]SDJ75520.1 hypothetical protein SAMN05421542_4329 [Chryseobacterium jejuense]SQB26341.1 Uncharacterised protein [Chryseobacterium jejuense]
MKNKWIILGIFVVFSCKAQQILPLNTSAFKSQTNSYFKDINNELDYYTGVWTSNFDNKTIKLVITKEIKKNLKMWKKNFYTDQLFIKYEVKKDDIVLESTLNKDFTSDSKLSIEGSKIQENGNIIFVFSGGNCSVGIGTITLKKINDTQFSWGYYPGTTTRIDTLCPPDKEYKIHLPESENLVFTKQ